MKEIKKKVSVYLTEKTIETFKKVQLQHMKNYGEIITYSDIINGLYGK